MFPLMIKTYFVPHSRFFTFSLDTNSFELSLQRFISQIKSFKSFPSLKLFGNSWGNLWSQLLAIIIVRKLLKIFCPWFSEKFFLVLTSLKMLEYSKNDNFLVEKNKNLFKNTAVLHIERLSTLFGMWRGEQNVPSTVFCLQYLQT